jgi:hypothetical protein
MNVAETRRKTVNHDPADMNVAEARGRNGNVEKKGMKLALTLREESKLMVLVYRVLRRIYGPKYSPQHPILK